MDGAIMVGVRAVFGLVLGLFLAVVGWFFGWLVTPPGPQIPTSLLISFSGIGAGLGGFIGWLKPEVPRRVSAIHLGLALVGGVVGAWSGWWVGPLIYPEGVRNPAGPFGIPPFIVAVLGAGVGANLLALILYIFRLWRYHEV